MTVEEPPLEPLDHPLRLTLRLAGLAFLLWMLVQQAPSAPSRARVASLLLIGALAACWLLWTAGTRLSHHRLFTAAVFGLSVSGGGLVGLAPIGMAGPAVAGLAGGTTFTGRRLVGLAVSGPLAALVSVAAAGRPLDYAAGAAGAAYAGLMGGISRRQYALRARQAAELAAAEDRAGVERDRADILAERNRLARDLHDVLAHSLGALAVQLEAVDAIAADADASQGLREAVRKSRTLVTDGLAEARRAVQALREDPVNLVERLTALAEDEQAQLEVAGTSRQAPPAVQEAVLRAAQESLANAHKHAAGAPVTIRLVFDVTEIRLTVANRGQGAHSPLAVSGSGLGLQGMRERVTLLGGTLHAGPSSHGWQVDIAVPG